MSDDKFHNTIELLSVELWREIFEYFNSIDLWYSFRDLNRRIDAIIDRTALHLNFTKRDTYGYFMKNILSPMKAVNVRSLNTCGTQQGTSTITSLITTTKTTNIQHVSIDQLTFNDLIKLLPALQNVKSFCTDYLLLDDNISNEQYQSFIIAMSLLPKCNQLHVKLSDDITFEHVEYLLKQTSNLKKLFMWGWYHLLDAKKWESLLSIYCMKLINFQLICTGPIFDDNFDQAIDDFQQICQATSFWFERNVTISDDEDFSAHDYRTDVSVQFNIKNKVSLI
ncbi:unnamed protein product [Rotaria sp. Silwood1]|nr:unnamed protein product [Rotaria sp. Silwood1]